MQQKPGRLKNNANSISSNQNILNETVTRMGVAELESDRYTTSIQVWIDAQGFENSKFILDEKILNDLKNAGIISS